MNRSPRHTAKQIGDLGEQLALSFFQQRHMVLVEKNFCCRMGEIDLIVQQTHAPNLLIFVEVRLRKDSGFGNAIESITPRKVRKISQTAEFYLSKNAQFSSYPCRIDAIGIQQTKPSPLTPSTTVFEFHGHLYWLDWRKNIRLD